MLPWTGEATTGAARDLHLLIAEDYEAKVEAGGQSATMALDALPDLPLPTCAT